MASRLLDAASIIASAEIASGTHGLVSDELRSRVDALSGWFRNNPHTETQAAATRRQIVQILARRLSIASDIARHPDILDEPIAAPIFVIGFPRTGTTLLQALFAEDPRHHTPVAWRVREPSPPPGAMPVSPHRLVRATAEVDRFTERCPGLLTLHPYWDCGAHTPVEDEEILTLDFLNAYPSLLYDAPGLAMRVGFHDSAGAYAFLRMFLQHQQWRTERRRWVLKGVHHQRHLAALLQAFPDALCIWPHREPGDFLPSNLAIAAAVYDGISLGALDRMTIASGFMQGFRAEIDRILADPSISDRRVLHVPFGEIAHDPSAAVMRAYEHWGLAFSDEAGAAVRAWLADERNRSDRYGRQRYDFKPFGVNWDEERTHYDAYRARFLMHEIR